MILNSTASSVIYAKSVIQFVSLVSISYEVNIYLQFIYKSMVLFNQSIFIY